MLYEPTNIIPSTMTQTGTVAATTDNVNIQWQVNGNSAMTMFQIDVMQNNADSTFVYSTGVVTEKPTVAQGYSLPFYGKDRFGDYVQFVYQPNQTWAAWSGNAISDGNGYKFRITQFYQENGTAYKVPITSSLSAGTTYYFSYSENGTTKYVSFTVANASYFASGNTIYFNFSHNAGWVVTSGTNSRAITDITFSVSETQPSGTQLSGAEAVSSGDTFYNQFFTAQNSASSFITRTKPLLTITPLTETPVASATQSFTATYSQEQGDSINTVRWQLFNAEDMNAPIDDTGEINTAVLQYQYNGLFNGQTYVVTCSVTTENNIQVEQSVTFQVEYTQGTYEGDFVVQPICNEDANILQWDSIENIPGVDNPVGSASVSNGQLLLSENSTVTWSEREAENGETGDLNFPAPWTAIWNGEINQISVNYSSQNLPGVSSLYGNGEQCFFNKEGTRLFAFFGYNQLFMYSIENGVAIQLYNTTTQSSAYGAALSNDGKLLAVCGQYNTSIYTVDSYSVSYLVSLDEGEDFRSSGVAFSPDGTLLVDAGRNVYQVSGTNFTFLYSLQYAGRKCLFSPNGSLLLVYRDSFSNTYIYSVSGTTISFVSQFNTGFSVRDACFDDNGSRLILAGYGYCRAYRVEGTSINELFEISNGKDYNTVSISEDGQAVIAGGYQGAGNYYVDVYGLSPNSAFLATAILYDGEQFDGRINDIAVSADNEICIVGDFTGKNELCEIDVPNLISNSIFSIEPSNVYASRIGQEIEIRSMADDSVLASALLYIGQDGASNQAIIELSPAQLKVYSFLNNSYVSTSEAALTYTQNNISLVQLEGEQICDYFAIISGDGTNIEPYLSNPNFVPAWENGGVYTVDLLADFQYGLDGGTATETGTGFRIYRRKTDGTENIELATLPSTTLSLRDYGIKSNESYIYDFYVYDANGAFMGVRSTETTPLKRQFKRFSLLSTQYNESDGCYHVVKEYQFSCNIQDMAVSNNSNKSYVQNFTPYPTVFQSTANYASGTLQALIGFVDPKAYKYWDSTQLMDELNALSTTTNTLFLKDMKGHLWMVDVGTVQMTATQKTREMQVTISLPWTEIGAASDVSIIQTPDDEGWDYGEQVLDVKLDVDVNTGLLYVTYPFPYNGTAFYLVGTNPVGSENIVQPLPETASSPQDGILKAKVRDK